MVLGSDAVGRVWVGGDEVVEAEEGDCDDGDSGSGSCWWPKRYALMT